MSTTIAMNEQMPFKPTNRPVIADQHSWEELEILRNEKIYCGDDTEDGRLLFASEDGIIEYDGYRFQKFDYPVDLQFPKVFDLHYTKNHTIYIYTNKGIWCYESSNWHQIIDHEYSLPNTREIFADLPNGGLLTITSGKLCKIASKQVIQICDDDSLVSFAINSNHIWLVRHNTVIRYYFSDNGIIDLSSRKLYSIPSSEQERVHYNIVSSPYGSLWITTNSNTIEPMLYDKQEDRFLSSNMFTNTAPQSIRGVFFPNDQTTLFWGKSILIAKMEDEWLTLPSKPIIPTRYPFYFLRKNGNIIMGALGEPIYQVSTYEPRWKTYPNLLYGCEDNDGNHWYVTENGKIVTQCPSTEKWTQHTGEIINTPRDIYCTNDGLIWVIGSHNGVAAISYYGPTRSWKMDIHPELGDSIGENSFVQLHNGNIIIGSRTEFDSAKIGAVIYSKKTNKSLQYEYDSTFPSRIDCIVENDLGQWMASSGLSMLKKGSQTELISIQKPDFNITWIDALKSDSNNNIWIGSWGNGLFCFDGNKWQNKLSPFDLISNQIVSIEIDSEENIWVATNQGIAKYQKKSSQWITNLITDKIKLQRDGGVLKIDKKGNLWINKAYREWYFRESNFLQHNNDSHIDFKAIRYTPDTHSPEISLSQHPSKIPESGNLYLSWKGVDYFSRTPEKNLGYSYQLDNGNWSPFVNKPDLILSNLKPGIHHVEIRCIDTDGNLSEINEVAEFKVIPLIWKRPWFIFMILTLIFTIVALIIYIVRQNIRHLLQLEDLKIQFFTNFSHDMRTPLTVITGVIETLKKDPPENIRNRSLELAHRNTNKMLGLINQLIDFRKIQSGKITCNYIHSDIIKSIEETIKLALPLAAEKSQKINSIFSESSETVWFDRDKLERIVDNLLFNAIKYTPNSGLITVTTRILRSNSESLALELMVEDNGIGIKRNNVSKIFEPFYRVRNKTEVTGSGLGLALVKDLVEIMSGTIHVQSPITQLNGEQKGTRFTVKIPIKIESPFPASEDSSANENALNHKDEKNRAIIPPKQKIESSDKEIILIVEDDSDVLELLFIELKDSYQLITAENGKDGFEMATQYIPDLIITDVMMPIIDGRDLCKKVKKNELTSHIPVIMLTALRSDKHELIGLKKGADDYLSKPVNFDILRRRIKNQFDLRNSIRDYYSQQKSTGNLDITRLSSNPTDKEFLQKVVEIIHQSLENPLFDVESLAEQLYMSRTTLYRKLKSITGDSPGTFIKTIRMNKAAELLKTNEYNVSEVALAVGVEGFSHFSAAFKATFGCTPKQYQKDS